MPTIILTGSLAYDHVMKFDGSFADLILPDQLDKLSVCFLINEKETHFGGCAGNIAYNLSLLEENPAIIGVVGNDFEKYTEWLTKNNLKTSEIITIPTKETACATIISDKNGNQITGFYPGASSENPEIYLENYKNEEAMVIISPDNKNRMMHFVNECQRLSLPYIFDPGQQLPVFEKNELITAINNAYGIILNEYEFHLLKKNSGLHENDILKEVQLLIITLGQEGSKIHTPEKTFDIPIYPPKSILDPTGCGDAYRAGILMGLKNHYSPAKSGRIASLSATYCIEHIGTQNHKFTKKEFEERLGLSL